MATFFESGTWVWIPDEEEVVLPAKARSAFRLGERATVVLENGAVSAAFRHTCMIHMIGMICMICVIYMICMMLDLYD